MKCPFCSYRDSRVVDSRAVDDGVSIRRRRECPDCGRRFTTYEKYEETPLMVSKKDGRRELFDAKKLLPKHRPKGKSCCCSPCLCIP